MVYTHNSNGFIAVDVIGQGVGLYKFDSSFGTLTAAELILYVDQTGSITLTLGNSPTNMTLRGTVFVDGSFSSPLIALNNILNLTDPDVSAVTTTGDVLMTPNSSVTHGGLSATDSLTLDLSSILADLTASGTVALNLSGRTFSDLALSGGGSFGNGSSSTLARFRSQITYTYTP